MTVGELIEELKQLPAEMEVYVGGYNPYKERPEDWTIGAVVQEERRGKLICLIA